MSRKSREQRLRRRREPEGDDPAGSTQIGVTGVDQSPCLPAEPPEDADGWQPGRTSWSPYRSDVLSLLSEAPMTINGAVPWGSNETFLVALEGGQAGQSHAIYKPQLGEAPLWDFPEGTLYRREYASYLVSSVLGWTIVPPTVVRQGPYGVGAVQLFIESERRGALYLSRDRATEALQRIAAFDCLVNNTDRKSEHCLVGADSRVWGIDHGLTFHRQPKLRTVIWDYADQPIPEALLADLEALHDHLCGQAALHEALRELLAPAEVGALRRRLEALLTTRAYPHPSSNRSVPWSMW